MPRRREVPKRQILPDPKYADRMVGRFINVIMKDGKKSTAERILYGAFNVIESKTRNDPLAMFRRALENVRPRVEVKSRRVGGLLWVLYVFYLFCLILQLLTRPPFRANLLLVGPPFRGLPYIPLNYMIPARPRCTKSMT